MNKEELFKFYGIDKNWPEETPRHIDYPEISLGDFLKDISKKYPESGAIYFEGFRMNYKELDQLCDQFASGLAKLGIKKGDVVAIDTPNITQYVIAFYAVCRLGAIVNAIIPLNRYVEIVHQVNDSKTKVLIILDVLYEEHLHEKDFTKMPSLEHIIMTEVAEYLPPLKAKLGKKLKKVPFMETWPEKVGNIPVHKFQDILVSGLPINIPKVNIDVKNETAVLIYTGGTTGVPKGVMTSHYNLVTNALQGNTWAQSQKPEIRDGIGKTGMLVVLPLAHSFACSLGMNLAVSNALKMILLAQPPPDLSKILKLIKDEDVAFMPGVPTLYNKINQNPKAMKFKGKLKSLVACFSGASALPLEVKNKFEGITGGTIVEGYGMSETSPLLTASPFDFSKYKENTVGFPVPDTFLKIVDADKGTQILPPCPNESCENCGADEFKYIGEICGCGPQVMLGYFGRPKDTEYALRKDEYGDVWYFTSDIGCIDKDGYLHIKDRKRDMIKYKGHGVFPREVEDLIYMHEAVNEVGVIGVPDPEVGQNIKAFISLKPEYQEKVDVKELMDWCRENISPYKYPRMIEIVPELPKSVVGKILRRELRKEEQ